MSQEVRTDMEDAWASAIAQQAEEVIEEGAIVVVQDDPYTWRYRSDHPLHKHPHIFRDGQEEGEPNLLIRDVDGSFNVVTLLNITLAMTRHTNRDVHLVNDENDVLNLLNG